MIKWHLNGNLFTHTAPKHAQELTYIPDQIGFRKVGFGGEYTEKNLLGQGKNQQQTQPTYDAGPGNPTRANGGTQVLSAPAMHCRQ